MLFVNDLPNHAGDEDRLDRFSTRVGPTAAGIPFVQVRAAVATRWLERAGVNLKQWIEETDRTLKPKPAVIPGLRLELSADVERQQRFTPNVAAWLPGETDEYLILGAHFDHLGLGEQSSLAPDLAGKAIHPGADDNASGTAGLLELAAYFAGRPKQKRGILFLAFSGEELGLLGSSHYVNHPLLPLEKAVAMINMDMIGRIQNQPRLRRRDRHRRLAPDGSLEEAMAGSPLRFDFSDQGGYGSSDHFSFVNRRRARAVLLLRTPRRLPQAIPTPGTRSTPRRPRRCFEVVARASSRSSPPTDTPPAIREGSDAAAACHDRQLRLGRLVRIRAGHGRVKRRFPDCPDVMKGSPAEEAGLARRRCDRRVRRQADLEPLRLHLRAADEETGRHGHRCSYRRGGEVREAQATLRSRSQMRCTPRLTSTGAICR